MAHASNPTVLESLQLPCNNLNQQCDVNKISQKYPCIICDEKFFITDNNLPILEHLLLVHKLVIADVHLISDFTQYVGYWKKRFSENSIEDFCYTMKTNSSPADSDPQEFYYFLCDNLPEDHEIRTYIQNDKLSQVLKAQQQERMDNTFSRLCLFCRQQFSGNRSDLLNHLSCDHSFNIGHPDNIVFIEEFLSKLETMLAKLQCLYCEKIFKDHPTLKEHMRKKGHRKLNPKNTSFDKFYIVNYLEAGKNWQVLENERDYTELGQDNETDIDWCDWKDDVANFICLFCSFSTAESTNVISHMKVEHAFDFTDIKKTLNLSFYQQVKLINYIRRQMHLLTCYSCNFTAADSNDLLTHMTQDKHISQLPEPSIWDDSLYYFPTYENDSLLFCLEEESSDLGSERVPVIPEDPPTLQSDNAVLLSLASSH